MLSDLIYRLRALFRRKAVEAEMDEELRAHLEQQTAKYVQSGLPLAEAQRRAKLDLGGMEQVKEECRDARGVRALEDVAQDIRYGLRQLRRNPGFTVVAVLTLALGIGTNTAIFGLVNAVLLKPLPYPHPNRLMHVEWLFKRGKVPSVTGEEYAYWRRISRVFQSSAVYGLIPKGLNLLGEGEPEYVKGWQVSREFFSTLGVQPFLGRGFTAQEDRPGGPRAVVLSYGLWQARFAASRSVIGREINLDGQNYSVVGVMPKGFGIVLPYASTENIQVWVPLRLVANPKDRGHNYLMVARLKPGVGLAKAQADMAHVLAEFRLAVPGHLYPGDRGVDLMPYQKWASGSARESLLILLAAVGLVFLIATANVANLSIARSAARRTEVAVRLALGAGPGRVRRQLLTESLLLAFAGGAMALAVAPWTIHQLVALSPRELPLVGGGRVDFRVLGFTLLIAWLAGLVAGLAPTFRLRRFDFGGTLKEGGRTSSAGRARERLRRWLVGGEIALSALLLSGALLLMFSMIALERIQPGFEPRNLWRFHISLLPEVSRTPTATWGFEQNVLARLKKLPGIKSATAASSLPLEPSLNFEVTVTQGGHTRSVYCDARGVSRDYFRSMEIPILRGRAFSESDTATSSPVVIVSRAFARKWWRKRDILGGLLPLGMGPKGAIERQIIGIAGNTKEDSLDAPSPPIVYIPLAQLGGWLSHWIYLGNLSSWAIRTSTPPSLAEIQGAVDRVDRSEAVADLRPMGKVVDRTLAGDRFEELLMSSFAGIAILLAAVGLYGVTSYLVTERTHEIGVRMALGARKWDVLGMIIGEGIKLALIGVAIGVAGALGLTRFMSSLLFGVKPTDPLTFVAVSLILVTVALVACYIPARRAAKVDPIVALRYE